MSLLRVCDGGLLWQSAHLGIVVVSVGKKSRLADPVHLSSTSRDGITHHVSALDHRRPEDVDRVGDHISTRGAKVHGVSEAHEYIP